MAYQGSTAASSVSNPPQMLVSLLGGPQRINKGTTAESTAVWLGGRAWMLRTTDSATLAGAAGYFTDAAALGMAQNDLLFIVSQTSVGAAPSLTIGLVSSLTTAGAFCSTATQITSTYS